MQYLILTTLLFSIGIANVIDISDDDRSAIEDLVKLHKGLWQMKRNVLVGGEREQASVTQQSNKENKLC